MKLAKLVAWAAAAPLLAAYGAWTLVTGALGLFGRARSTLRLLRASLRCPSCGAANPLHGRWRCRPCGAVFHGFVGACALCGAGASFFPCRACGVSIPLGGAR